MEYFQGCQKYWLGCVCHVDLSGRRAVAAEKVYGAPLVLVAVAGQVLLERNPTSATSVT
jgi:hypothetical protein